MALHMHPAQSRRLHTLTFGARDGDGEICLKHSVSVGKLKIDGTREHGPCKYAGRGNERGLQAVKSLGRKEAWMAKCRNPGERLQGDSLYLPPFYIFPVFEKGMKSTEEKHRGFMAVTEVR